MERIKWYYWLGFDFIISLLSTFALVVDDEIDLRLQGYIFVFTAFMIVYPIVAFIGHFLLRLLSIPIIQKENNRFADIISIVDDDSEFTITTRDSDLIYFTFNDLFCAVYLDFRGLNIGVFIDFDLDSKLIRTPLLKHLEMNYKDYFFAQHMIKSSFMKWKNLNVITEFKKKLIDMRDIADKENLNIVDKEFFDRYL